jgi:hypothetical protein
VGRLRTIWARLKGQAVQSREDDAFSDEIREHSTLLTQHYQAQGISAEDAARAARRQFGNVTQLKEWQRWQRGMLSPSEWARDVRFGMRMLAKKPGLHAAMVIALALGIGATPPYSALWKRCSCVLCRTRIRSG